MPVFSGKDMPLIFDKGTLSEEAVGLEPFSFMRQWLDEAIKAQGQTAITMSLATCGPDGQPSVRTVVLRELNDSGHLLFYTNYDSPKGRALEANPKAEVLFYWPNLQRQVRVKGSVVRVPAEVSDQYFATRPHDSRVAAWLSAPQSSPVADRPAMQQALRRLQTLYPTDRPVPRPPFWGGYALTPVAIEFWQGREFRLHDRIAFNKVGERWERSRLLP